MSTGSFFSLLCTADDPDAVAAECLARLRSASIGGNLGFLYCTQPLAPNLGELLPALQEASGVDNWTGCSGYGVCADRREVYERPAMALMTADLPVDGWAQLGGEDVAATAAVAAEWMAAHPGSLGLLHADGGIAMQDDALTTIVAAAEDGFFVGGLSSGDEPIQIANGVRRNTVSGALFAPEIPVTVDHTQGCTPIGPFHRITSAQRNIAITLDGQPALDVLRADIGELASRDLSRAGNYIFAALPVPGSDTRDYKVRNLLGLDTGRGLIAVSDYLEGQEQLMFCRRDGNTAREDLLRMCTALRSRVGNRPIRGGVYVSCLARGRHQFGDDSDEVRTIQDELGQFPMVGFFANGEIYNGALYGYTGVLTLFL